jgi:hypothetical protein
MEVGEASLSASCRLLVQVRFALPKTKVCPKQMQSF